MISLSTWTLHNDRQRSVEIFKKNSFAIPPTFVNTQFQRAYVGGYLSTSISLNPNMHIDADSILPKWPLWDGKNEMLYNVTEDGAPVVQVIATDSKLLDRCK
jgi:hypothetical protein